MNKAADLIGRVARSASLKAALTGAIGYFLLAATTIRLTSDGRNHATVWPADAIILALLLVSPRRRWPIIILAGWAGNFAANGITRGWMIGLLLYGAINMAQTALAAVLLQRSNSGKELLADTRSSLHFLLSAGILGPALGAFLGSLASLANYGEAFGPSFIRWFASNALGLLIVTPVLKGLLDGSYLRCYIERSWVGRLEALGLHGVHIALTAAVFDQNTMELLFLPICSLLLLSFRLGRLGTQAGVIMIALIGGVATYRGLGPVHLMHQTADFDAIFFQVYLGTLLCTALPVAASVSANTEALTRLAERDEALSLILSNSPDAIISFDAAGVCRWAAGRLEDYLGAGADDLLGATLPEIAERTGMSVPFLTGAASGDERATAEFSPARRSQMTLEASIGLVRRDGARLGSIVTLRDVSARKAKEAAISRMAETDDLTGALNRKGFRHRLDEAVKDASRQVSLALIDVDHFKSINDTFGHTVGDRVLQEVVARIKAITRNTDAVARLGGDEFAILFDGDMAIAQSVCERLTASFGNLPVFEQHNVSLHASISCGIAELHPNMSKGHFFEAADIALYDAKHQGRGCVRAAA
ncbi:sensor domain-containing diguanylate cyclase [Novosphingobium album (ex Hu et al. 2023)]|uniref:diguanylate cyclase n=1 Tax=Novosphingobium album (ex Hu et al. 2023) TaxID=2930093 RepID=A0ABT0B726_9SPHN|nr:sensor domain-containing diguanylate cyclase [Novosphingobium album (ex Hu et al. 2023)]MCJ2180882.1 diguanylate cyclase [Novosphingobium album (ex Hu et al. 2023)]